MSEFPVATSPAPGVMGVDWENRVDFERLRQYRLDRVRMMLEKFELGAVLVDLGDQVAHFPVEDLGARCRNHRLEYLLLAVIAVEPAGACRY